MTASLKVGREDLARRAAQFREAARNAGVRLTPQRIEVRGLCRRCAQKERKKTEE